MNLRRLRPVALLFPVLTALPASAINLLTNGSFEVATGISSNATLSAGATNLTGWTVIGGGNLLWCDSSFCSVPPSDGAFSLDLTGLTNVAPYAGVQQFIATLPGAMYELTFDLSGRSDSIPVSVQATAGTTTSLFSTPLATWSSRKLSFTATSSSTMISIVGVSAGGTGLDIQIDNAAVSATQIPEPSRAALFLCGGLILIGSRYLKRSLQPLPSLVKHTAA
jgi:Protein of unknown function (DUF642)